MRRFRVIFKWYDCWVGLFWDRVGCVLYVFLVPMLGLRIDLAAGEVRDA